MPVVSLRLPKPVDRCLSKMTSHAQAGQITTLAFIAITPEGYVVDVCGDNPIAPEMMVELQRKIIRKQKMTG